MRPGKDKWSGRILDPTSGSSYDSTIALKGSDTLRVPRRRLWWHVLRRPDLDPRELKANTTMVGEGLASFGAPLLFGRSSCSNRFQCSAIV